MDAAAPGVPDAPGRQERTAPGLPVRPAPGAFTPFGEVSAPVTAVLVRHGQTVLTEQGAYSGSSVPGPGLSATGRVEAARAADLVARVGRDAWPDLPRPTALFASPMTRAQETAAAIGRRLGLRVQLDPDFAEADFGTWEGRTALDIAASDPAALHAWHRTGEQRAPGGESVADVGARVERGLARLAEGRSGTTAVVAAHTIVLRAAVGTALHAPVHTWNQVRIPPGSLVILRRWPDGATEVTTSGYAPL
ncbi:MAG: histidine phosphatase family protein [Cellulomonadaceae bacterium]